MSNSTEQSPGAKRTRYWRQVVVLTTILALIWLLVSMLPLILAGTPDSWTILGWPFAYATVAFGAPLAYLLLIGIYAFVMGRHDKAFCEDDESSGRERES